MRPQSDRDSERGKGTNHRTGDEHPQSLNCPEATAGPIGRVEHRLVAHEILGKLGKPIVEGTIL